MNTHPTEPISGADSQAAPTAAPATLPLQNNSAAAVSATPDAVAQYNGPQKKESLGMHILRGALSAMAGPQTPNLTVDPQTGKVIATPNQNDNSFKRMFGGILAGAMTGLAGGFDKRPGESGDSVAALARGYEARTQQLQQEDEIARQHAFQQFNAQQQADKLNLDKAFNAKQMTESIARAQYYGAQTQALHAEVGERQAATALNNAKLSDEIDAHSNAVVAAGGKPVPNAPAFSSRQAAYDYLNKNPDIWKNYSVQVVTDPKTQTARLYELPQGTKEYEVTMPDGKKLTGNMTAADFIKIQSENDLNKSRIDMNKAAAVRDYDEGKAALSRMLKGSPENDPRQYFGKALQSLSEITKNLGTTDPQDAQKFMPALAAVTNAYLASLGIVQNAPGGQALLNQIKSDLAGKKPPQQILDEMKAAGADQSQLEEAQQIIKQLSAGNQPYSQDHPSAQYFEEKIKGGLKALQDLGLKISTTVGEASKGNF